MTLDDNVGLLCLRSGRAYYGESGSISITRKERYRGLLSLSFSMELLNVFPADLLSFRRRASMSYRLPDANTENQ